MIRSLWTAATGMNAQQINVDTIANNLSNVNTVGYKAQAAQFKTLLYQTLQSPTTTNNGDPKPTTSQVGLGVRPSSINGIFSQGPMLESSSNSAFAIEGKGFFAVRGADGGTYYTRNGDFVWALTTTGIALTTSDGLPVLDTRGQVIQLPGNLMANRVTISSDGGVYYPDATNNDVPLNMQIGLWQFENAGGLERNGNSLWSPTAASGTPVNEATARGIDSSVIRQGYLEGSNVMVADEMVNLIVAQRAFEINSKAITTSDEMMQTANNLKR